MGGGGKRKSRGGGEGPTNSRKRKTAAAAIPTRRKDSTPSSDIDEPQLEKIIKMQLESESKRKKRMEGYGESPMKTRQRHRVVFAGTEESEPVVMGFVVPPIKVEQVDPDEYNNQHGLIDESNSNNKDLASVEPSIDISDVFLMRPPKVEPMIEDEDLLQMDSNTISVIYETETTSIDFETDSGGNGHASSSTSNPPEWMMSPTEYDNGTGVTTGDEKNETTSNCSLDSTGNPLPNEMTGEREGTARTDGDNDTTAVTIDSQHFIDGTTAAEEVQEMLPRSGSVNSEVLKNFIGVSEKNVENVSNMQKGDGDIFTRLTAQLKEATDRIELLQRKVESENFRNIELSNQIKLSEKEVQNYAVQCEGLKEELEEAKRETEKLTRVLHSKNVDLERETSQVRLSKEALKNLAGEFNRQSDMFTNILSDKDGVIQSKTDEIGSLKETIRQLDNEKERLTNSVITKLAGENNRFQDERTLINVKNEILLEHTVDIEGLRKDCKIIEHDLKGRKAELDEERKLADEKLRMAKEQREEANRKNILLANSISEKDIGLALFKAKYFRDQQGNSLLHLAAKKGDEKAVKELIKLGVDVETKNNNTETPIILAASSEGNASATLRIVKSLIEHRAELFASDSKGHTFLHKFTSNKNPPTSSQFHDLSSYLVSKNMASLFNIRDTGNGTTPFMMAARNVKMDITTVALLQTNGVNFNLVDNRGRSFLFYAAEGKINSKLLADSDGNGIIKYKNLAHAIEDKDEDSVYLLVNLGADVNEKTGDHLETPLHLAARSTNKAFSMNAIKLLIDSGANVDARNNYGSIFLHKLFNYDGYGTPSPSQFHELASFLVSKDLSRLFNTSNRGCTPLHVAVKFVEIEGATLTLLKNNGVDFNAVDDVGRSILHCAIHGNRTLRLISDLVAIGGANPNPKHLSGDYNSMHLAAIEDRLDLLKFFVDHGLDVNAQGSFGYTPLHCAIYMRENALKTVQFLLRNGANPDIVDERGKSPRDIVNEHRLIPEFKYVNLYFPQRIRDAGQIAACFSLGSSC